jgi:hypothetical protein
MVDFAVVSGWGLAVLKWLRELPETVKIWRQFRRGHPAISIVPRRNPMYDEATQPDGTIATQIVLDCLITNGRDARLLLIPRAECHVRWCGTVQEAIPALEQIPPRHSVERRLVFHFSRALNKPRGCTVILYDQFGKKHKKRIRGQATQSSPGDR